MSTPTSASFIPKKSSTGFSCSMDGYTSMVLEITQLVLGIITLYKEIHTRKKKNTLKPNQIRAIIKQILEGIKYLQERGIMHHDIKP